MNSLTWVVTKLAMPRTLWQMAWDVCRCTLRLWKCSLALAPKPNAIAISWHLWVDLNWSVSSQAAYHEQVFWLDTSASLIWIWNRWCYERAGLPGACQLESAACDKIVAPRYIQNAIIPYSSNVQIGSLPVNIQESFAQKGTDIVAMKLER